MDKYNEKNETPVSLIDLISESIVPEEALDKEFFIIKIRNTMTGFDISRWVTFWLLIIYFFLDQ